MWVGVKVPVVSPVRWPRTSVTEGLIELERIRREVEAASSLLMAVLGLDGRDAAAEIARTTGVSTRTARDRVRVAGVVDTVAGAAQALVRGEVTADHLRVLAPVTNPNDAAELLLIAASQTPEEFSRTVTRFEVDRDSNGVRDRQRNARSVRFFDADHGCIGMRAVLPPVEGAELRAKLQQLTDDAWRAAHPDRADMRGGHDDEPYERRMADALISMTRGDASPSARPALVVTLNAETLHAEIIGEQPIPTVEAFELAARAELYAAIRDMHGGILKFGRSRRLASPLQKLASAIRDRGCSFPGCDRPWQRCEAHHVIEYDNGGPTDLHNLALLCNAHHHHLDDHHLQLTRQLDGTWTIQPSAQLPVELRDTG